jgi:hypothetical protein
VSGKKFGTGGSGCLPPLAKVNIVTMVDGARVLYRWKVQTAPWVRKTGGVEGFVGHAANNGKYPGLGGIRRGVWTDKVV